MRSPRFPGGDSFHRAVTLGTRGPEHRVQFYDSDDFLAVALADFVARGLRGGHQVVAVATEPHRRSITERLRTKGFDVDRVSATGQLTLPDAGDTIDSFMVGSTLDVPRCTAGAENLLQEAQTRAKPGAMLYLCGEMVDLLCRDGKPECALQLERMWNKLSLGYDFSLLCVYAMDTFHRVGDAAQFEAICGEHTHVAPTEAYMAADTATLLHEITILEQRARALESEIEHRKQLERELSSLREEHQRLLSRDG
jgi:MEDS: MEthanogen/methylotroph, DcmR Sensory domain